jgi:hypothetical protein
VATKAGSSAQPVSWDRHQEWSWQIPKGFDHARDLRSVPITLNEAVTAAACFVLVFVPGPTGPMPHALLRRGAQGHSPFVGREGQWQASWLPPRLSAWPFDLAAAPGGGHAFAVHEDSDLVVQGPAGHPIFAQGDGAPALASETVRSAAILKTQAEALPATARASAALADLGLLTEFDPDRSLLVIDPQAAADLNEAGVLALHRSGALALLHAGLVSHAHLAWMEKAERLLTTAPPPRPSPASDRQRIVPGSRFLAALAADRSSDEALIQFSGLTRQ